MEKVVDIIELDEMPFDKFDVVSNNYIHATGNLLILSDGRQVYEYEDELYKIGDFY